MKLWSVVSSCRERAKFLFSYSGKISNQCYGLYEAWTYTLRLHQ